MKHDRDPTTTRQQEEADLLVAQAHGIIEVMRRKRLNLKLLKAALDALRTINGYKPPCAPNRRSPIKRGEPPPIVTVTDLLRE
ncbi:hypothetical protein [Leptolyngbya sp. FACHB-8]|uniref:hypothetical protein n=1 Tax=unclassified Leptolyngbya TaxID=2650499 RepID=UPI00168234D7|nr:hypothetical protein [Leptolyngbya sp. FACHB-8]MBD1910273.1 hypothetical protein [Leptolyngbya sp. FACHB-8]